MESKAGSILALIGGVLTLVFAGIVLIFGIVLIVFASYFDKFTGEDFSSVFMGLIMLVFFIILLIGGVLKLYASKLMRNAETTVKGGILAVIFGILVSDIFTLIGGIIGIVQGSAGDSGAEKKGKTKNKRKVQKSLK